MFPQDDPRTRLAGSGAPAGGDEIATPAYVALGGGQHPDADGTWTARGQNFVVTYSEVDDGARLERDAETAEYLVVVAAPGTSVEVQAGGETVHLDEPGVIVVPPGDSAVVALGPGTVVRIFDTDSDVAHDAANAASYDVPHPRVTPAPAATPPIGGHTLRVHRLADHPPEPGRFGAIFRSSRLMVNFLGVQEGPRDPEKLSPHHHDDFEQGSLTLQGSWLHHIRTPWTSRRSTWREDEHHRVDGASLTIIPPPTVHTSEAIGSGTNLMLDIFSPPRTDFAAQGWVLNDGDYPAP